jgi:hypothetical protein
MVVERDMFLVYGVDLGKKSVPFEGGGEKLRGVPTQGPKEVEKSNWNVLERGENVSSGKGADDRVTWSSEKERRSSELRSVYGVHVRLCCSTLICLVREQVGQCVIALAADCSVQLPSPAVPQPRLTPPSLMLPTIAYFTVLWHACQRMRLR